MTCPCVSGKTIAQIVRSIAVLIAKKFSFFYGWIVVGCCFLLCFVSVGIAYNCWSVFTIPICEAISISREQFARLYTFILFGQMATSFLLSAMIHRFGERTLMRASAVLLPATILAAATVKTAVDLCIVGLSIGLALPLISFLMQTIVLSNWFVRLRGTMIGIAFTGSGLGGLCLLSPVERWIAVFGWQRALIILSVIMAAVTIPVCYVLMVIDPADIGQHPDGKDSIPVQEIENPIQTAEGKVDLLSKKFILFIIFVAGCYFVMALGNTTTPHLCDSGYSSAAAARIHAFCCGSVALCRALGGRVCDKLGLSRAGLLFSVLLPTLPIGLLIAGKAFFAPVLVVIGFGIANSATAVYTPLLTAKLFGKKNYSRTYSKINAMGYFFGAVTPIIYGKLYTLFGTYNLSYCLFTAIFVIGVFSLQAVVQKANTDAVS